MTTPAGATPRVVCSKPFGEVTRPCSGNSGAESPATGRLARPRPLRTTISGAFRAWCGAARVSVPRYMIACIVLANIATQGRQRVPLAILDFAQEILEDCPRLPRLPLRDTPTQDIYT